MRWMVRVVSGLVMLAALALGAVLLIPAEEVARLAARQAEAATGRALEIGGPVKAHLWPGLAVETGPVRLANADWAAGAPMAEAEALRISLDMAALIGGSIRITGLELVAPVLRLERHRDGRANWDLAPKAAGPAAPAQPRGFSLALARMHDGRVSLADGVTGARYELSGIDATLQLPGLAGPAALALSGRLNGQPIAVNLSASPASALVSGGVAAGRIGLAAGGSALDFQGSFGHSPLAADGALHVEAADRAALSALLGTALPEPPQGLGARIARLDGRAVLSPGPRLVLRDALAVLDDTRLRLSADLQTAGSRPQLTASVTAETPVVLPAAAAAGGQGGAAGAGGWSTAPIDLTPLTALDADIGFAAPAVSAGALRLGALRGRVGLAGGRAVITLTDLAAYDGRITGTAVLNAAGRGSARADLTLENLALRPLLRDAAGTDRLTAQASGTVSLLSSTASVSEMMHRLQGEGRIALGKGELRGLDLLGMLRTMDVGYVGEGQRTIFDSLSTSFSIAEGVLRADDLRLAAPYLQVAGSGTVGIGARVLDYRLAPVALQKEDGSGGLRVPLRITGPWSAPRYRLDAEALAKPKLDAERARAERKLAGKLGADTESGETLEDAAKRKLETELRRGLGKLFGN